MFHHTGEKPGIGVYTCLQCGQRVRLDEEDDNLPPCPRCHATEFTGLSHG